MSAARILKTDFDRELHFMAAKSALVRSGCFRLAAGFSGDIHPRSDLIWKNENPSFIFSRSYRSIGPDNFESGLFLAVLNPNNVASL